MRKTSIIILLLFVLASTLYASEVIETCDNVYKRLKDRISSRPTFVLSQKPIHKYGAVATEESCGDFPMLVKALKSDDTAKIDAENQNLEIEMGMINGKKAAVVRDGPNGSGHYWTITVAVELNGKILGACTSTSTSGWRALESVSRDSALSWRSAFASNSEKNQHLILWEDLPEGSSYTAFLYAVAYRLQGTKLILDNVKTKSLIRQFGELYQKVAEKKGNMSSIIYGTAAKAYLSFAEGKPCTKDTVQRGD